MLVIRDCVLFYLSTMETKENWVVLVLGRWSTVKECLPCRQGLSSNLQHACEKLSPTVHLPLTSVPSGCRWGSLGLADCQTHCRFSE